MEEFVDISHENGRDWQAYAHELERQLEQVTGGGTQDKLTESRVQQQKAILVGINRIFEKALTCETEEDLGQLCLDVAQDVTGSTFGYIGEINPETGRLDEIAICDPNYEACRRQDQSGQDKQDGINFEIHGLYSQELLDGKSFYTNDPASNSDNISVPAGCSPLTAFLSVPLVQGGQTTGIISLGNRDGGYGDRELEAASALAPAIVQAFTIKRSELALQQSEHSLAFELEATRRVHDLSVLMINGGGIQDLYEHMLDAAMALMRSDFASIQIVIDTHSEAGRVLHLLAWRSFHPESARFWEQVPLEGASSCGEAFRRGERVIFQDIEQLDRLVGSGDLEEYHRSGIRAMQSTPLHSREGRILGMVSTHWRQPHEPSANELRIFDILVRQISELIERQQAERALKEANERLEQRVEERTRELKVANEELEQALQMEQVMRQQLIQTEKYAALARLVASVAHEINNPLQTVQNSLYLLKADQPPGSSQKVMEIALSESKRIGSLVQQLRESYRPSDLQQRDFNLIEMLEDVQNLLALQFHQSNIQFQLHTGKNPIIVNGLPDQIKQVFLNICLNALDALEPEGGNIQVSICDSNDDHRACIAIQDNGPGIPPEYLDRVFEPFFTTKEKGTGLGLAICYEIMKNHEGEITVESQPGEGTTFRLYLPIKTQQ